MGLCVCKGLELEPTRDSIDRIPIMMVLVVMNTHLGITAVLRDIFSMPINGSWLEAVETVTGTGSIYRKNLDATSMHRRGLGRGREQ